MISDESPLLGAGRIIRGVEPNASIKAALNLLMTELDVFAQVSEHRGARPENGLTQKLCRRLIVAARDLPFQFMQQAQEDESDGQSRSVDLGVLNVADAATLIDVKSFAPGEVFFVLEAKRLPTPRKAREREYVTGDQGGIERFKRTLHGMGKQSVGVLAYIQKHDFKYWYNCINGWIEELAKRPISHDPSITWSTDDKLQELFALPRTAQYKSLNARRAPDGAVDSLEMFHIWVLLVD